MTAETNNARGFAVGDRVRAIFVSAENKEFIRQGDTGTVKHIESDGDLWVKWDNPADSDQQDCGWCINADHCERIAPPPAAARVDVRGLVTLAEQWDRDAGGCRRDGYMDAAVVKENCAFRLRQALGISAIGEALAAEGVQAGEVAADAEQRGGDLRNLILMDAEFSMRGSTSLDLPSIQRLEARGWVLEGHENCEYDITDEGRKAIVAALSQQPDPKPEARGVVDEVVQSVTDRLDKVADYAHTLDGEAVVIRVDELGPILRAALTAAIAAQQQEPKS